MTTDTLEARVDQTITKMVNIVAALDAKFHGVGLSLIETTVVEMMAKMTARMAAEIDDEAKLMFARPIPHEVHIQRVKDYVKRLEAKLTPTPKPKRAPKKRA